MEAARKRNIRSGEQYTHLFPKAEGSTKTIRKNADVTHTVAFIPKVVSETLDHTKKLSEILKGKTTYETCSNIWHFVYQHIAYTKDQEGYEQIRSPARAWHDRKNGVDCDCYSVFISSILTNCNIPHILRITKYHRDYFQHIYPVVVLNQKEIPIDCVTDKFNYEVPYSEKKDYPMDLQYLNGFEDYQIGQLGKAKTGGPKKSLTATKKKSSILSKINAKKAVQPSTQAGGTKPGKKGILKKVLNTVNRVNPPTVLLRNGILAAMKLNIKNVAKRLRWSYLTPDQAAQKGIDPQKFQRLIATREKLEKIFYGAGGNPKNLKQSILSGKGNADKGVAGLNGISFAGLDYMSTYTPLPQILGPEIYYAENVGGFEGLGQLGEPITLASVGAAMGVLAGIVAALKQIGDIFPKGSKNAGDFDEKTNEAAENNVPVPGTTAVPLQEGNALPTTASAQQPIEESFQNDSQSTTGNALITQASNIYPIETNSSDPNAGIDPVLVPQNDNSLLPVAAATASNAIANSAPAPSPSKESFWDKNKTWLKPVAIGVGGISLIAIGFAVLKPNHISSKSPSRSSPLSGLPKSKKKKRGHQRKVKSIKAKHTKKKAVALL